MKYCNKCKVNINYEDDLCPLCQNIINGETNTIFPLIPNIYNENKKFFKYLITICISIITLSIFLNIIILPNINFSIFVIFGIISLLIILKIGLNNRYNISKTILLQIIIISIFSLLWDYFTGNHKWAITYVIPISCAIGTINIILLLKIFKIYIEDYLIYFIVISLLGIIPIIFILFNLVLTTIPSLICIFINIFILILLIIFKKNEVLDELKRRLHI